MEPYPLSVRRRIVERYLAGEDTADIAERYGFCESGVRRVWQRHRETGSCAPRFTKPGTKPRLDAEALVRLSDHVKQKPDATLAELREAVGVDADLSVYCRMLKKLGLTRKKSRPGPASRTAPT
jgi:transposase